MQFQTCRAQFDDAAESAWATPLIDAIDVFRNDPICLPCLKPSQLTVLPGIGARTASRISRLVRGSPSLSIDEISDSLCLSIDQQIILLSCATMNCNCTNFFSGAQARTRISNTSTSPNSTSYGRIDVRTEAGRMGMITQRVATSNALGGWLVSGLGNLNVAVGDFAARAGAGLVIGSAGGFGRSPLSVALSVDGEHAFRPWTSTWQEGMHRGILLRYADSLFEKPLSIMSFYSSVTLNGRHETNVSASANLAVGSGNSGGVLLGVNIQSLVYSSAVDRNSMRIVNEARRVLASVSCSTMIGPISAIFEAGADDSLRPLGTAVLRLPTSNGAAILAARYMHADVRNPYGTAVSSLSAIGNEWGITAGMQWSERGGWRTESSVDVHGIVSASYGRPLMSYGINATFDAERKLNKHALFSCRFRYESDDDGYHLPQSSFTKMITMERVTMRCELTTPINPQTKMRARIDVRRAWFDNYRASETGALAFAELAFAHGIFSFKSRVTVYSAQSPDVAPYSIEQQTDGYMRTVMGSGQGSRMYMSATAKLIAGLKLSISALRTIRFDKSIVEGGSQGVVVQIDYSIN
ncbi:MAG: hypothetical protein HQ472_10460 [Ignavibacteria bacterium]|nr:hypothetical protein [Ignavibacteria bacterium]